MMILGSHFERNFWIKRKHKWPLCFPRKNFKNVHSCRPLWNNQENRNIYLWWPFEKNLEKKRYKMLNLDWNFEKKCHRYVTINIFCKQIFFKKGGNFSAFQNVECKNVFKSCINVSGTYVVWFIWLINKNDTFLLGGIFFSSI